MPLFQPLHGRRAASDPATIGAGGRYRYRPKAPAFASDQDRLAQLGVFRTAWLVLGNSTHTHGNDERPSLGSGPDHREAYLVPWIDFSSSQFVESLRPGLAAALVVVVALTAALWRTSRREDLDHVEIRTWKGGMVTFLLSAIGNGTPFGLPSHTGKVHSQPLRDQTSSTRSLPVIHFDSGVRAFMRPSLRPPDPATISHA